VSGLTFSPDCQRLISASHDRTVKIWDILTGQVILTLTGHDFEATSVAISPDAHWLASGGGMSIIKLWDASPLEPETNQRREVLALVRFLFGQGLTQDEVLARIRKDPTIADSLRLPATSLAQAYARNLGRQEAERVLRVAASKYQLKADILVAIRTDPQLNATLRQEALAAAERYVEIPETMNIHARPILRLPGQKREQYRWALRLAQAAAQIFPEDGTFLTTLGLAQYRTGNDREAVETLTKASRIHANVSDSPTAADLAFLAMALHRLNRKPEAQETLRQLRKLMEQPTWSRQPEARGFLREAEELIEGKSKKDAGK
jgi:tetratricopeptide (TPR) repeat protein